MRFSLSEEDRARLGAPEVIEYDQLGLSTQDAEALESAGVDWTIWGGTTVGAIRAAVWLAMRKSGVAVDLAEVQFNIRQVSVVEAQGKAPSARSGPRTPSPSAPTGRRSPRKRSPS